MRFDPTLFESPMYETANEAVLYCLEHLNRNGHAASTASLTGLPPVSDAAVGQVVYQRLLALRGRVSSTSVRYIDIALNALGRALAEPEVRAVA